MEFRMDAISRAIEAIKLKQPKIAYKLDEPLKNYTTFKIGGPARIILFPESKTQLKQTCDLLSEVEVRPLILGNGSNVLVSDKKLEMVVINTSKLDKIKQPDDKDSIEKSHTDITIEAGALLSKVAVYACEKGLSGLEFAYGIPGTIGGAVVMNAGAYDREMKDVVINSAVYNTKAGEYTLTAPDHGFSYRQSHFSNSSDIVLSTTIRLQKRDTKSIKDRMDELITRRQQSQPLDLPSGGSTFKRPKEGYAAALIEQANLKGFTIGGAQVSEKHAGFIVNKKHATFAETKELIDHVREVVYKQFGIELELEIKIIS